MKDFQLPDGLNKADYWCLQIDGVIWQYLVDRLVRSMREVDAKESPVIIIAGLDLPMFLLKRKFISVEQLMTMTGLTQDTLENSDVLKLIETRKPDLPEPTVSGWGTA